MWAERQMAEYLGAMDGTYTPKRIHVWYIYSMCGWFFMVNAGKYASPMDGMGNEGLINRTRIGMNGALQVLFTWALLRDNSF